MAPEPRARRVPEPASDLVEIALPLHRVLLALAGRGRSARGVSRSQGATLHPIRGGGA